MLRCQQAAQLASERLDRELGWRERVGLRLHLAMCRHCRRYARQLQQLRKFARQWRRQNEEAARDARLSTAARQRIASRLDEAERPDNQRTDAPDDRN